MTTEKEKMEKYAEAYEKLNCFDISLSRFIRMSEEERKLKALIEQNYFEKIPFVENNYFMDFETPPREKSVQRTVVIDGANVMHCGSSFHDSREGATHRSIPDVMPLLSLIRYFVSMNFNTIVILSSKYLNKDVSSFQKGIQELVKLKVCSVTHNTNLDDVIALKIAATINGVVITNDKFRDHQTNDERYREVVEENCLNVDWIHTSAPTSRSGAKNHFVGDKKFVFVKTNGKLMRKEEVEEKLFVDEMDSTYELAKERREDVWSDERREKILTVLNSLIVEGLTACAENVKRILEMPVYCNEEEDDDDEY